LQGKINSTAADPCCALPPRLAASKLFLMIPLPANNKERGKRPRLQKTAAAPVTVSGEHSATKLLGNQEGGATLGDITGRGPILNFIKPISPQHFAHWGKSLISNNALIYLLAKRCTLQCTATAFLSLAIGGGAFADDADTIELPKADGVSFHLQSTFLPQGYLPFHPAPGDPASGNGQSTETWTITGYFGAKVWDGGEVYFNPEMFHGFLLRDFSPANVAIAASVGNGEAQKGGRWDADLQVARLYITQTIGFGGEKETIKDDLNRIAGTKDISRLTLTFVRLAANDAFDNNAYAHDPRSQFQNWALLMEAPSITRPTSRAIPLARLLNSIRKN
jgi:hypothetical protein